jgi:flagellar hook-associated protein 3 FlgL
MRVNPNPTDDILLTLFQTQQAQQTALQQISTGKRVNQPSDDPAAAALYAGDVATETRIDQYLRSVSSLRALYQTGDSVLGSVVTSLNQAITLGTEAANGPNSAGNLQQILQGVQAVLSQVVQLANTSFHGSFIFGGTATTTPPFTLTNGVVTYNGNSGINFSQIGDGTNVQVNVPGNQIFQQAAGDVFGALQQLVTALQNGDKTAIGTATTSVGDSLQELSVQRSFYGNSLNQLSADEGALNQLNLNLKTQDTTLVGVDLAKAATDLSAAQVARQATLAASAKVLQPSLLDYLK